MSRKILGATVISWMILILSSCMPMVQFLGDPYETTAQVDTYYAEKDITVDYRTIGNLVLENDYDYNLSLIHELMVKKAKEVGADGILFPEFHHSQNHHEACNLDLITAKLIKYK